MVLYQRCPICGGEGNFINPDPYADPIPCPDCDNGYIPFPYVPPEGLTGQTLKDEAENRKLRQAFDSVQENCTALAVTVGEQDERIQRLEWSIAQAQAALKDGK